MMFSPVLVYTLGLISDNIIELGGSNTLKNSIDPRSPENLESEGSKASEGSIGSEKKLAFWARRDGGENGFRFSSYPSLGEKLISSRLEKL